ncbi:MAG: Gfo/Idh/MocA family oxidoreductase [Alphaproteobacteria bacterium]|tara:strand:- start:545 stop:2665 length:2121 start_codon:yes stop_codon:yes gene_type:complete
MKQIFLSQKGIEVLDVPVPKVGEKEILVKNCFSCISPGTELAGFKSVTQSNIIKILKKPYLLKSLFNTFIKSGIGNTSRILKKKLNSYFELGYSSSGIVEDVGSAVKKFKKGDYVACSGGGYASHAEIVNVPENLAVRVYNFENLIFYSSAALGSISLQSVRRLSPTIGETFIVVGLGFLGQITMQILAANGSDVYGIDPNLDFISRAKKNGFDNVFSSFDTLKRKMPPHVLNYGFDGAIITASNKSNEILSNTFSICRKKSRVVIVGDVGLNINRNDIYKKEIDFLISSSYGPGRYDPLYEEEGFDYPLEYVRWTLNRNMQTYVDLIDRKKINLSNLIEKEEKIENAKKLYEQFTKLKRPLSAVIKYDKKNPLKIQDKTFSLNMKNDNYNSAIVGVGGFSEEVLIPNLKKLKKFNNIKVFCVDKPVSVLNKQKNYEDIYVTNNYDEILKNKDINLIFISTRHNLHYPMTIKALKKGKNVFCEKPLCISPKELNDIKNFFSKSSSKPLLITGFNRRFSESAKIMKNFIESENVPIFISYTVNADHIPSDSWIYGKEGGGRNIGEACHFYDLILFLIDKNFNEVNASSLFGNDISNNRKTDNFFVNIKFSNGSIAQLNYLTNGVKRKIKEYIEIRGQNRTLVNTDFRQIKILADNKEKIIYSSNNSSKGHFEQYEAFFNCLKNKTFSIPLVDQIKAMELSFKVEEQI